SWARAPAPGPHAVFPAASANTEATVQAIERLGLPVIVSQVATLDDVYRDVQMLGEAVERQKEAAQVVAEMRARLAAVSKRVEGLPPVRAVVIVWSEPLVVAGSRSHVATLLRGAGGVPLADVSSQPFPTYSLERLVERAPEALIVGSHADVNPPLAPLMALTSIPAVKNHRIILVDGDLLFRPGPRLPEGVEA